MYPSRCTQRHYRHDAVVLFAYNESSTTVSRFSYGRAVRQIPYSGGGGSASAYGAVLEGFMKTIRCDLPFAESIEIHPMSDLHIGDAECDYKMVMDRIEYIKNTKDAWTD